MNLHLTHWIWSLSEICSMIMSRGSVARQSCNFYILICENERRVGIIVFLKSEMSQVRWHRRHQRDKNRKSIVHAHCSDCTHHAPKEVLTLSKPSAEGCSITSLISWMSSHSWDCLWRWRLSCNILPEISLQAEFHWAVLGLFKACVSWVTCVIQRSWSWTQCSCCPGIYSTRFYSSVSFFGLNLQLLLLILTLLT